MATRLYLGNAAASYTPTTKRGAWDNSAATLARRLSPVPEGAAATAAIAETSATNAFDVLWGRWISDPAITAGTLSGTVQWIAGVLESNTAANDFFHVHIFVTAGDTDTVRGTLLTNNIGATEFTTTATGRGEGAKTVTNVAVQVGDRIVVEIGYVANNTVTTSYTGTLHYGNTGTADLAQGGTTVTTSPGWVEFSGADGLFYPRTQSLTDAFSADLCEPAVGRAVRRRRPTRRPGPRPGRPHRGHPGVRGCLLHAGQPGAALAFRGFQHLLRSPGRPGRRRQHRHRLRPARRHRHHVHARQLRGRVLRRGQ